MSNCRNSSVWTVSLLVLGFAAGSADAQTARSGGTASAQLVQQLQQLASERTSLQAENARMKKELDDLRKERDALKKGQQGVDQHAKASMAAALAQSASQRETVEQELKQTKDKMQELIAKFRETVQTMRQVDTERATAKQTLVVRDQELKVCVDRNMALYKLNGDVLAHLEGQSAFSRVARAEPFTKIKRVELENLVDDYKARAEDQRVETTAPHSPATAPAPAAGMSPSAAAAPPPAASAPKNSTER
jgi:chromosome segregation ATPase